MSVLAINPATASSTQAPLRNWRRDRTMSFEDQLRAAPAEDKTQKARKAAQQFVGVVFIEPILASMRETNQATGAFAPGDAERRFGPLLDQHLSDRITSSSNFPLVDSLEKHFLSINAGRASGEPLTTNGELDVVG